MTIAVIYGSERRGSTYHIVRQFLERLHAREGDVIEFFLPRDMPKFCAGCSSCFARGEATCPHREWIAPIQAAMLAAELLIFATPVYAMRASGQMKTFLDHFAFQFLMHRPPEEMFSKTALIVTTAAGGGTGEAIRDVKASLDMWGVARVFSYGRAVFAADWSGVSDKKKAKLAKSVAPLADKIAATAGRAKPRMKVRLLFHVFRVVHKRMTVSAVDHAHWEEKGWLGRVRPWARSS